MNFKLLVIFKNCSLLVYANIFILGIVFCKLAELFYTGYCIL